MKNNNLKRNIGLILSVWLVSSWNLWGLERAAEETFEFFERESQVVTASRRPQTVGESPLAVDVITEEEIKSQGAVNLWDLLRYRAGLDVLEGRSINGNRAIVSVRGFPQEFAQNVLVLLDGRSVYSPDDDGVYWNRLPVSIEDIHRIEIVRGPNAALYGTGAALGVINIITKKPSGNTAVLLNARGGSLSSFQSYQGGESSIGKVKYRVSHHYRQEDGFPSADGGNQPDFLHRHVANLRAGWQPGPDSDLEFFAGRSWNIVGLPGLGPKETRSDADSHFQMARLSHRFSPNSAVEAFASRNDGVSREGPSPLNIRILQHDADVLHRLEWWDQRLFTSYGMSYRDAQTESSQRYSGRNRVGMKLYRGYFHQLVKPADRLSLQGAVALESSDISGMKPSYQTAAVFQPTPLHALRASYSVARTIHDFFPLFANYRTTGILRLIGDSNLEPVKTTSYEVGYHGSDRRRRLRMNASLYYTEIKNLHASAVRSVTFNPPLITLVFNDQQESIARGAEVDLEYDFSPSRSLYANYTHEYVTENKTNYGLRSRNTPVNKLNLGGRADVGYGISGGANLGFKDNYFITSEGRSNASALVPANWRLDLHLAYALPFYRDAELFFTGQNLLVPDRVEFPDGLAVPRTLYGGVSVKWSR